MGNSCVPGVKGGVSCQMLAAALYRDVGFCDIAVPEVPMARALYNRSSLMDEFLAARPEFVHLPPEPNNIVPGDLLGFRLGRSTHHMGVCIEPGRFVHAMENLGVTVSLVSDPTWRGRLTHIWRPV